MFDEIHVFYWGTLIFLIGGRVLIILTP
jgi:hypothetical protein